MEQNKKGMAEMQNSDLENVSGGLKVSSVFTSFGPGVKNVVYNGVLMPEAEYEEIKEQGKTLKDVLIEGELKIAKKDLINLLGGKDRVEFINDDEIL